MKEVTYTITVRIPQDLEGHNIEDLITKAIENNSDLLVMEIDTKE